MLYPYHLSLKEIPDYMCVYFVSDREITERRIWNFSTRNETDKIQR